MPQDLLTIEDQEDRYVRVFGERYLLRRRDDLSIVEERRFASAMRTVAELANAPEETLTPTQVTDLTEATRTLCALALDAPATVVARLKDGQCSQIATLAFFGELLAPTSTPTPPTPGAKRVKSSRRSKTRSRT